MVRNLSFVGFAAVTLALGVLGAFADVQLRIVALVLAAVGAACAITLAVFDSRATKRTETILAKVLEAVSDAAVAPTAAVPTTFREQAFKVLSEMEAKLQRVGEHPTDDEDADLTLGFADGGTLTRARRVRIKAQTFLGYTPEIQTLIRTFPIGLHGLQIIARAFARMANEIPADIPADPSI